MNEAYRQFIDQFCRAEGIDPPEKPDGLLTMKLEDTHFFISPFKSEEGVRLQLIVHYGEMPAKAPALAYRRLLEANLQALDALQPKFGIDAESGSVVLTGTLLLGSLTPKGLMELLREQAMTAEEWRQTGFMTPEELGIEKPVPPSRGESPSAQPVGAGRSTFQRLQGSTLQR